jgi:hypothetical protein
LGRPVRALLLELFDKAARLQVLGARLLELVARHKVRAAQRFELSLA